MKILINTPSLDKSGGVANHFKGLKSHWKSNVTYNYIGGRNGIAGPIILIYDYFKFIFFCALKDYDVVVLNPSLGKTAIVRDSCFLKVAKLFKIETVVFFHGWGAEMVEKINKSSTTFATNFNKADKILVLSTTFKEDLINWGITKPIYLTTTKVDPDLLEDFDIEKRKWDYSILFLSRIEEYKGIFTVLEAYKTLKIKIPNAKLIVAGDGSQLAKAREFVESNNLEHVCFLGNVSGQELVTAFIKSSLYILPSHGEGMPTSVLEAMAFGLPIISRPVGGLVDFFEEGKMGYLLETLNPDAYAEKIIDMLEDQDKLQEIGEYNHQYAKKFFMATKVANELEKVFLNEE